MWDTHKKTHLVNESKIQIGMHWLNMLRHAAHINNHKINFTSFIWAFKSEFKIGLNQWHTSKLSKLNLFKLFEICPPHTYWYYWIFQKQVDILISKNQVLQILYLNHVYKTL